MAVEKKILLVVSLGALFAGLFYGFYQLFYLLRVHENLKRAWEKSEKVLKERRESRKSMEREVESLYGEMEKKSLMAKIDCTLTYSGLNTRFPVLTAEKLVQRFFLFLCVEVICIFFICRDMAFTLTAAAFTALLVREVLQFIRAVRKKQINDEFLHCIDYMEINASASNDIIEIIRMTALKVKEPLKSELFTVVFDAKHCGNKSEALRRFCNRIEHKYMKDLILNLDTCSRQKENYKEVLKEAKKIMLQDLANQERLRKMYRNTFFFTLALGIGGQMMLQFIASGFMGGGNVLKILWESGVGGKIITLYCTGVFAGSVYFAGKRAYM